MADLTVLDAQTEEAVSRLPKGPEFFHCPPRMRVNEKDHCTLRIGSEKMVGDIFAGFRDKTGLQINTIDISSSMKARLWAEEDEFDIRLIDGDEERYVGGRDYTEWKWRVLPLKSGEHTLHLTITALVKLRGVSPTPRPRLVASRTIYVAVNAPYAMSRFIHDNVLGSIIVVNLLVEFIKWACRRWYSARTKARLEAETLRKQLSSS